MSVADVTSEGLDNVLATLGHVPDISEYKVNRHGHPHPHQCLLQFLKSWWRVICTPHLTPKVVPDGFYGFKFGEYAAHSSRSIPCSSRNWFTTRAWWRRALSSISIKSGPRAPAYGKTTVLEHHPDSVGHPWSVHA